MSSAVARSPRLGRAHTARWRSRERQRSALTATTLWNRSTSRVLGRFRSSGWSVACAWGSAGPSRS
jgi:hypothetical protein